MNRIISSFDISTSKSNKLCLFDPMILCLIIIVSCLLIYIIGFSTDTYLNI